MRGDTKTARHQRLRAAQKRWLDEVVRATGRSLSQIARDGQMDHSTLTRFYNDEERGGVLHTLTISTIVDVTGHQATPEALGVNSAAAVSLGVREPDAEPYAAVPGDPLGRQIGALMASRPGLDPWVMKSRALEFENIIPGDILIVDLNGTPRPRDVVCAQIHDWNNPGNIRTVFRILEPPFLVSAGPDADARRPHLIDNQNVIVKGAVETMIRPRITRAA